MSLATSARARATPDDAALIDERSSTTWAELDELINRAANGLLSEALGDSGRVAVFAENSAEVVIVHAAATSVGISSVPVNFHLTAKELAHVLSDSETAMLFVGPETADVGLEAAAISGVRRVVGWRCDATELLTRLEDWLVTANRAEPPSDMPPRPHLYFTSGTTGLPKGVEAPPTTFAGGATVAEYFDNLRRALPAGSGRPALIVTPCYHNSAIRTLRDLFVGTPVVVLGRFDAERTLAAIEQYRIESVVMVPTHFQRMLALPDDTRARYDVSSLTRIVHTGAACPIDVKHKMIEWLGPIFVEVYGATEAGTTNSITTQEWLSRPGSIGRTVEPFELEVIGENGDQVGPGVDGLLYFRDRTGRGIVYHNAPEKTRAAHRRPGVFTLGEIGHADDEGYVYITDRSSDMVVSGGVNLYPAEVEKVLALCPEVADVAVIGVPNADMGEELKALVVAARRMNPPDVNYLDSFCRARLSSFKCPRSYEFVSDVGRTAMGKVDKRALRAPYWPSARTIGG